MKNAFEITECENGGLSCLKSTQDIYGMNWVEGGRHWGSIYCPDGITHTVERKLLDNGNLQETYCFTNSTDFPLFIRRTDIGIYTTFNDNYEDAEICLKKRCHTHIFCGGNSSWVMALRMGGQAPHLGLKLTEGSLCCYSVERRNCRDGREENLSNDRGDFILHPEMEEMQPGESVRIVWELFWFQDREDFERQLLEHKNFMVLETKQCTVIKGEQIRFKVKVRADKGEKVFVEWNGRKTNAPVRQEGDILSLSCVCEPKETGRQFFEIIMGGRKLRALFYVSENPQILADKRCKFIACRQQYHGKVKELRGAYLIYDNEDQSLYYNHRNDYNGGRERVGMGILLARYLQEKKDEGLQKSLKEYVDYVYRELWNEETGEIYNDIRHAKDYKRLYNGPWFSLFQLELYNLYQNRKYLKDAFLTLHNYYLQGGGEFYPIMLPAADLFHKLKQEGMQQEADILYGELTSHGDWILERSLSYQKSEVDFEQSIVAPAVDCLTQAFQVSGDKKYLVEAGKHLAVLKLFHAKQPDYHQFGNAIRHWDGYWFGKNKMPGDTYPHYWSALTGAVWIRYVQASGEKTDMETVSAILRGVLSLFNEDGTASCAMVFPAQVNRRRGHFYDPWANDQDWGLYLALKYSCAMLKSEKNMK